MTKLSDTQALILSAAAQRPEHIALPLPESLRGGAAAKVVGAMLAKGFLQEVDADTRKGEPVWRETGDGHGVTLVATDAGWGIYIREDCTIRQAYEIAKHLRLGVRARGSRWKLAEDLIRASFYAFYLHEQFHHKVESFAFRLLVSTRRDCYRPYQSSVYVPNFRTMNCIEEIRIASNSRRRT